MAKLGLLGKLGLAGLLGLGSVTATSCTPIEQSFIGPVVDPNPKKSERQMRKDFDSLIKIQGSGITIKYQEYLPVMTATEKYEVFGTYSPTKDSKIINSLKPKQSIKPIDTGKPGNKPITLSESWRFYVEPYAGVKFPLRAEDKPDPMPVFGAKIGIKKDRSGFYLGAEYGEMDSSETSSAGYLDLKSKATKLRLGAEYDVVQGDKFTLTASAGPTLTLEGNEIKGRVGTYEIDDSKKETIVGLEAGLGLEYKFNDRVSLTAGATYGHNLEDDNSNVTDDLTGRVGVKVKF